MHGHLTCALSHPPPIPPQNQSNQAWPGDLLHGVLPGALQPAAEAEGSGGDDPQAPHRTTLVFAFWRGDPREEGAMGEGGGGGDGGEWPRPMMDLPRSGDGSSWIDDLALDFSSSSSSSWREWQEHATAAVAVAGPVEALSPAFVQVRGGGTSDDSVSEELPPLRYFLRSADDIARAYLQNV